MRVGRRLLCKGVTERARGRERKRENNCTSARERENVVSRDFDGCLNYVEGWEEEFLQAENRAATVQGRGSDETVKKKKIKRMPARA